MKTAFCMHLMQKLKTKLMNTCRKRGERMIVRAIKFGELKKGDRFTFPRFENLMVKINRIKDGNDGCFYTAVDVNEGTHYKIADDTEVYTFSKKDVAFGEEVDAENEYLYDGFIHVICKGEYTPLEVIEGKAYSMITNEYTKEDYTLAYIQNKYPDVDLVIYESALWGELYSYNEYRDGKWRRAGRTKGYA